MMETMMETMMKRNWFYIAILLLMLLCSVQVIYADNYRAYRLGGGHTNMSGNRWRTDRNGLRSGTVGQEHHMGGIYIDGSYAALLTTSPIALTSPGGYAFSGGLCYEYQMDRFRLQTGLGVRWQDISNSIADSTFVDPNVYDARGNQYALRYDIHDRMDRVSGLTLQVPLLFGFGKRGFYGLTGVKANLSFARTIYTNATVSTSGTYDQYAGHFVEMDNHGMRKDVAVDYHHTNRDFRYDLLLSLELGYEWGEDLRPKDRFRDGKPEYRVRIAGFIDWGMINLASQRIQNNIEIPDSYKWDVSMYQFNNTLSSNVMNSEHVHSLYAGIKLTVLLGTYTIKTCQLCAFFESERVETRDKK